MEHFDKRFPIKLVRGPHLLAFLSTGNPCTLALAIPICYNASDLSSMKTREVLMKLVAPLL
jgi:hypothetical protein